MLHPYEKNNVQIIPKTASKLANTPLGLYIHLPWCLRKCPYCDFNSHALRGEIPESIYTEALMRDLDQDLWKIKIRPLMSIFIGGGTPSLFSSQAISTILSQTKERIALLQSCEITLEANPGTAEQQRFNGYRKAGVNRLSIGCQSFQADKLVQLGRIHGPEEAIRAAKMAQSAGFTNFNLDLMFGLPGQTITDALFDLETAISLEPTHISWYQLTLEPNTMFHHSPPKLPNHEAIWAMQQQGQQLLATHGYQQYEVSAYARPGYQCQHNLNYWNFGDYLGIGAGAHSKLMDIETGIIQRLCKTKQPKAYIAAGDEFIVEKTVISKEALPFEFMLNALRLNVPVSRKLFTERTGLDWESIAASLSEAQTRGLIEASSDYIELTARGKNFLDDVVQIFL